MNLEEYQKQRLNSHPDMHSVQLKKQAEFISELLNHNQENISTESPAGLTYS